LPHYLDKAALRDLVSSGMEIGTHGMYHRDWRKLNDAELHVEIASARRRIEDICGTAVTKAGVSFGSYDRRVLNRLRSEHFEFVYTADGGLAQSDAWLKPRRTICSDILESEMKSVITSYPTLPARLRHCTVVTYKRLRGPPATAWASRAQPADRRIA
jgi:peptidoglycan/xylan/chitin deacetylase (PgdA/CDA1 family)